MLIDMGRAPSPKGLWRAGDKALATVVAFALPVLLFAQKGVVEGTLRDDATGETLIGATVKVNDSTGVSTDIDGHYSLELPYGKYTLKVASVGYEELSRPLEVKAPDRKSVV